MPLSEDEQRILHEIERQFYEQDPAFARQVGSTTIYRHAGRNLKWATIGFLGGLVLMLWKFQTWYLGFLGFAAMFACTVVFERNLRRLGKAGWKSMTSSFSGGSFRNAAGDARRRLRDRFKRGE